MTSSNNALTEYHDPAAQSSAITVFGSVHGFEAAQRMAKALATSDLVPEAYRGNLGNCLIAMEIAQRTGAGILAVTQNLHVIEGRPAWSSAFIIAALNTCGRFSPLRFTLENLGEKSVPYSYWEGPKGQRERKTGQMKIQDMRCVAWAYDKATGEKLEGPAVTIEMAVREGWYARNSSKWQTMPELMLRYRAAAFFGRLYAPDVLMGMHSAEEVEDVGPRDITPEVVVLPAEDTPAPSPVAQNDNHKPTRGRKAAAKRAEPSPDLASVDGETVAEVVDEPSDDEPPADLVDPVADEEELF